MLNKRNSRKVSWTKNISRKERKDAKILKSMKSLQKKIFLNASRTKKNLAPLRSLREILHQLLYNLLIRRNYAGKSILDKKNSRKERKDAKILKNLKPIKKDILKCFAH
ncbi:hypothetical protein [Segatella bryantii]|uniref:hypothetical protein n=1 Tax=Segatella bryantii TaxID=77095 RepID=UPI0028531B17|nr:hypothetical protein [Segatella bryantii]MDR4932071.1 hypothetical protein [Segatella bryantii]